jgi:hypothetical protein
MTVELRHEPVHSKFGGSGAARVLRCPSSVDLIQKVPAYLRKPSAYADRGTALHAAITLLLAEDTHARVESLAGKMFGSYTVTHDDVENALRPAYAYVETLLDVPGAEYYLDRRVIFPTIADTFGTVDLLVRIGRTIHVIDFKFGAGVRVLVLSPDGDEDVFNSQLLFYACATRHSLPKFFAEIEDIVLTIVQPMSIEPDAEMVSSVAVTHAELDAFIVAYRAACEEALSDAALAGGIMVPVLRGTADLPGAHEAAARFGPVHGAGPDRHAERSLPARSCRRPEPRRCGQGYSHGAARPG